MARLRDLPEIAALEAGRGLVRIPPELDVPLTPRVRAIVDSAPFRRLAGISQLGLVARVYPGATHSRFEHSLGVFRLALLFLRQLDHDPRFAALIDPPAAEALLVAALLHDVGHWPFCHPIEDLRLPGIPAHEAFAERYLCNGEIADCLHREWQLDPAYIIQLLTGNGTDTVSRILYSILSGPIDIDKMDYLQRDSLHAGVPYGRNFDPQRLIASLCLNAAGDGLAITDKGKTAAEMMVFARYVMFSEVYWHHGVRSGTAMLQRAFFLLYPELPHEKLWPLTEPAWIDQLRTTAGDRPAGALLDGLFGPHRQLYKRVAQYSYFEAPELYGQLAYHPYEWLLRCAGEFARLVAAATGTAIDAHEILFDAPPVALEVQFKVQVHFPKEQRYRPLGEVSPVVRALAREQFDDYVKRVRVFAHPRIAPVLRSRTDLAELLQQAIEQTSS